MSDFPDWQDPVAIADQISLTGVPLLNLAAVIGGTTITPIAVNGSSVVGPFNMNQVAYELYVAVQNTAALIGPTTADVTLSWTDNASGLQIWQKSYRIVSGPNGSDHVVKIQGPSHADRLTVTFANSSGSGNSIQVTWKLLGSSRLYKRDVFRTLVYNQAGFTNGSPVIADGILCNVTPNVAANGTSTRLLAAYSGRVQLFAQTTDNNNTMQISVQEATPVNPLLANSSFVYFANCDTHGLLSAELSIPGIQCNVNVINNAAAAKVCFCTVAIIESDEQ